MHLQLFLEPSFFLDKTGQNVVYYIEEAMRGIGAPEMGDSNYDRYWKYLLNGTLVLTWKHKGEQDETNKT